MAYRDLTDDQQVEALRPIAHAAAEQFELEVTELELVAHAFNTTFAVAGSDGERHALRVHTNSVSTPTNVVAQQSWQHAIATETDILVPDPLRTVDGGWYAVVGSRALGQDFVVTGASWLEGPDVRELGAVTARELGRVMATLHDQAESWTPPAGGNLTRFDAPLFGDVDLLDTTPSLAPESRAVLDTAREATALAFTAVHDGTALIPVHADLHGGNLKWDGQHLAVFDFDDSGLGLPLVDLAVSTFYLRGGDPVHEQALRAGYAEVRPLPEVDPALFEGLVAARQLLLANSLLAITTAKLRRDAEQYLAVTIDRLSHWLETGTFTRALPGR